MNKPRKIETSFISNGQKLYEQIGETGQSDVSMFVEYDVMNKKIEPASTMSFDGIEYIAPAGDLVRKGAVLLPTYPKDYGSTAELIREIEQFIRKYLDVSDQYLKLASYYALLTWVYDCFEVLPYLRPLGDFGTGKTRFQKVIGSVCYKPMFCGGATTTSPIFRIIDLYKGTLVLDEGDFQFSDATADLIKILNCGYAKGVPVLRTEGEVKRTPVSYDVYGPKIIGTRRRWQDKALESRCLTEIMRGTTRPDIPIHLPKSFDSEALELRNQLLMFRFEHYGDIEVKADLVIPNIEPRINQIVLPLLSLIDDPLVLAEIREFVIDYAQQLRQSRGQEVAAEVLRAMCKMVDISTPLQLKQIAKVVNEERKTDQGEQAISPSKIGRINASDYNFKTRQVHGVTEIIWDVDTAQRLCDRYGVEWDNQQVDDVDLVDQLAGIKEPSVGGVG